ncbi:MAG: hypothetical protein IPI29_08460 [Ignavibacteria bacterium]|nr:hypothetical protein [Ignavibacteria bacterium]
MDEATYGEHKVIGEGLRSLASVSIDSVYSQRQRQGDTTMTTNEYHAMVERDKELTVLRDLVKRQDAVIN